jgi:hypothetical protein
VKDIWFNYVVGNLASQLMSPLPAVKTLVDKCYNLFFTAFNEVPNFPLLFVKHLLHGLIPAFSVLGRACAIVDYFEVGVQLCQKCKISLASLVGMVPSFTTTNKHNIGMHDFFFLIAYDFAGLLPNAHESLVLLRHHTHCCFFSHRPSTKAFHDGTKDMHTILRCCMDEQGLIAMFQGVRALKYDWLRS